MSREYNEWEAKSIESELDKIRAKYLMSPSDFEKSSSLQNIHINKTGTFKVDQDSVDTRNQSTDKYGNEIREFIIDHPLQNHYH
jgi:predicted RNA-binding protein with EMAP domain